MRRGAGGKIIYIILFLVTAFILASMVGLIPLATLIPKPGWTPPKCSNPDSFIAKVDRGKWSFSLPEKYVMVQVVDQKLTPIKVRYHEGSDEKRDYYFTYTITLKYNAKPFYAKRILDPLHSCSQYLDVSDKPFEGAVKVVPEILVSETLLTGYKYPQDFKYVLKGSGVKTIQIKYPRQHPWITPASGGTHRIGVEIKLRLKDENGRIIDPPCSEGRIPDWSIPKGVGIDLRFPTIAFLPYELKTFRLIFGEDPWSEPVDACNLFVKYPAGDWPMPAEFEVEPVDVWSPGQANQLKISFKPRGGIWPNHPIKLIMTGPARDPEFLRQGRAYKSMDTKLTVNGELIKTLDAKYFKYPGYYLLKIETDWGGYILSDQTIVKVGEPSQTTITTTVKEEEAHPVVAVGGDFPIKETSETYNVGVKTSDPADVEIDWGDGSKTAAKVHGEQVFSKAYSKPGNYTVDVKAYEPDGSLASERHFTVTVEPSKPPLQKIIEFFHGIWEWFLGLFGLR